MIIEINLEYFANYPAYELMFSQMLHGCKVLMFMFILAILGTAWMPIVYARTKLTYFCFISWLVVSFQVWYSISVESLL